jgi:hypothetical protein
LLERALVARARGRDERVVGRFVRRVHK